MMSGTGEDGATDGPAGAASLELRQLTDPRDMRALAHPVRLALLEALGIHGALTATQAGEQIGESPSSCSFHLRTLARHHFVEETGGGRGRERPWRLVNLGTTFAIASSGDPETWIAAETLSHMFAERQLQRLRQWWTRQRRADPVWVAASTHTEYAVWLTPEELTQINATVNDALSTHKERLVDPSKRPEGAELIELLYFSFPFGPGAPPADEGGSGRPGPATDG